jgi:phage-related protein
MAWEVLFYETQSGRNPALAFLKNLSQKARTKCFKYIEMLEERGFGLPSPYLEKVRGDIWALRPEFAGNEYRIFFFNAGKNRFVITHAILKNTRRIEPNDIDTAENRMDEWLKRKVK